jgi:GTP-binding protein Era
MSSELVREKLLRMTEQEIPHSITCVTSKFEEKKDIINITVDIIVDRDPIKKIVIGKNGSLLKAVGIEARKDIESLLGKQVYLELYVKTIKNWRDKERYFKELGFNELND